MNILFALLAVLIIYPILHFIPVKMTAKQKFTLLIVALVISLIGIFVNTVIPLWQSALLMAAFAGLASMFMGKRMIEPIERGEFIINDDLEEVVERDSIHLFPHESDLDERDFRISMETNPSPVVQKEENLTENLADDTDLFELASLLEKQNSKGDEIQLEKVSDNESSPSSVEHLVTGFDRFEDELEEITISTNVLEEIGYVESDASDNTIAELEDWSNLTVEKVTIDIEEQLKDDDNDTSDYLSEIEKLLFDEEADALDKKTKGNSISKEFTLEKLS
jgi:hypothetical protein